MTVELNQVYSGYRRVAVVKDINFTLNAGEIVGLIGLNGAGKSTLLKTILGLIKPIEGEVLVDGQSILTSPEAYASAMAYIPETPILYEELTLREHLQMTALGYGISVEEVMRRAQPLLERFRLDKHLDWFPTHFSKGMKQKVMIICAFVTDANVFIIDEPFLGLDSLAIRDLTRLMEERAQQGATILFTTHVLSMVDSLCHRYLILQAGEIVGNGSLEQLQDQFQMSGATLDDIYIRMAEEGI